jgi:hypothetical protein
MLELAVPAVDRSVETPIIKARLGLPKELEIPQSFSHGQVILVAIEPHTRGCFSCFHVAQGRREIVWAKLRPYSNFWNCYLKRTSQGRDHHIFLACGAAYTGRVQVHKLTARKMRTEPELILTSTDVKDIANWPSVSTVAGIHEHIQHHGLFNEFIFSNQNGDQSH